MCLILFKVYVNYRRAASFQTDRNESQIRASSGQGPEKPLSTGKRAKTKNAVREAEAVCASLGCKRAGFKARLEYALFQDVLPIWQNDAENLSCAL